MKRILITIDEKTANLLEGSPNRSETVRQALKVYHEDISTDTLAGMRKAFRISLEKQEELETQIIYLTELVEKLNAKVGESNNGY